MGFQANVLDVMIASPGDVAEERNIVAEECQRWNDAHSFLRKIVLRPIKWETHSTPQLRDTAQGVINEQLLEGSDIVIGIFGTRIGTPTAEFVSGSVEEIKRHVAAGKTAKVYFSDVPVSPSLINPQQYSEVQSFREECKSGGLYGAYSSLEQFRKDFKQHLDIELNQARYIWLAQPAVEFQSEPQLSERAIELLKAAEGNRGSILFREVIGGDFDLLVGGAALLADKTPRAIAAWKAALQELADRQLIERAAPHQYMVTDKGYRALEVLAAQG